MDKRLLFLIPLLLATLWLGSPRGASTQGLSPEAVLGSGFIYQGYLKSASGAPLTSTCDLRFSLWNSLSGGVQIGVDSLASGVNVNQGYFSTLVNAGNEFGTGAIDNANARWLEVEVQCSGDASFTILAPRQALSRSLPTHDHLGQTWSGASVVGLLLYGSEYGLVGNGSTTGVYGESSSTQGTGVYGITGSTTGPTEGVYGQSVSTQGTGVSGETTATTGNTYGVYGQSASTSGNGVYGYSTATTGTTIGVRGENLSNSGIGVYGRNWSTSGITYGVAGINLSSAGYGVYGSAMATTGINYGIYGRSDSQSGRGVYGYTDSTTGITYGIYGRSDSSDGRGVTGSATSTTGTSTGVFGASSSTSGFGVVGNVTATTGINYGVYGNSESPSGYAGYFTTRVYVGGLLTKAGGGFKIDHPLDPANQYLYHSFVESPEMKNVYDGIATLDANGQTWVQMPAWFEALNRDFRYQLTPLGGAAPDLHIAQEIQSNSFLIAGGLQGMRVSWLVTGVRHDPWAEAHRIPVEQPKPPEQQNKYLHPELYGMPPEQGVSYQNTLMLPPDQPSPVQPAPLSTPAALAPPMQPN